MKIRLSLFHHNSLYFSFVLLPVILTTAALLSAVMLSYFSEISSLNHCHQARLYDLLSRFKSSLSDQQDLEGLKPLFQRFGQTTGQPEFFKLHLFLVESGAVIMSTDLTAVGESLSKNSPLLKPFSFRRGETTVGYSVPLGNRTLVVHEDITLQAGQIHRKFLLLLMLTLFLSFVCLGAFHKLFRAKVAWPLITLKELIQGKSKEPQSAGASKNFPIEFHPLFEIWNQKHEHIDLATQRLIEAEKKASCTLLTNSVQHCLSTICALMAPISLLPAKSLSGAQINSLKNAAYMVHELSVSLQKAEVTEDLLELCQRILKTEPHSRQD